MNPIYPIGKTKKAVVQEIQGLQLSNDFLPSALGNSISQPNSNLLNNGVKHSKAVAKSVDGRTVEF